MWWILGFGSVVSGAVALIDALAESERADDVMARERHRFDVGLSVYDRASRERALLALSGVDRSRLCDSQRDADARIQDLLNSAKYRARNLED